MPTRRLRARGCGDLLQGVGGVGGDHVHVEGAARGTDDRIDDGAAHELGQSAAVGGAEDELGGVLGPGHLHQRRGDIGTDHLDEPASEVVEEGPVARQPVGSGSGEPVVGAHVDPDQLGLGAHGHPGGPAHEHGAARCAGQGHHDPLLGLPRPGDVMALAVVVELLVHAVGHPQQGQLAQRGEVALAEVVAEGGVDALGRVDVAVGQPAAQCLGGHVHQLDLVRRPHHPVRHRLLLGHPGDALDDVVQRLQVLEVDRRDHVDPGVQQGVDVLPALGVGRPRDVGVGQLVHQDQFRSAGQQALQVHLLEGLAPVLDRLAGEDRKVADLGVGLRPAVLLDPADHHVGAAFLASPALVEHGVRLADPGGRPQVEP